MASRARDLANLAKGNLTIDASGDLDVSGTVVADGLNMAHTAPIINITDTDTGVDHQINASSGVGNISIRTDVNGEASNGDFFVNTKSNNRLRVLGNGDISFYDNTATTQGFYWDASAQSLGIGTTSPTSLLTIGTDGTSNSGIKLTQRATSFSESITFRCDSPIVEAKILGNAEGALALRGGGQTVDNLIINTSGNVGIGAGETSLFNAAGSTAKLVVTGNTPNTSIAANTDASIVISNTSTTAGNTSGLHFARADTDDSPNFAGASIVAQFPDTQATGQYPRGELAFLTSTSANAAPSEKMRISAAGNVGIGTVPNAASKLHVSGGRSYFASNSNAFATYLRYNDSTAGVFVGSPSANAFRVSTSSGATRLDVDASGNLTATGNVTAYSDERLKSDITTIDNALDKVTAMRGVTFTKDGEASSGVIAQELEKIAPELVMEGEEYKSVAYGNLVGYLIEAVKELSAKVEELENASSK